VVISSLTSEFGEPVLLPGGGFDSNPENDRNRVSRFISHIPILSIPEYEFPECDSDKYATYQELVNKELLAVPEQTTLIGTQFSKYTLDVMDATVLPTACTTEVASNLFSEEANVVLNNQTTCLNEFGTLEWLLDPCCSPFLTLIDCCVPFSYNTTLDLYTEEAVVSGCDVPECAESYYEELSFSLNYLDDSNVGCTNGIKNYADAFGPFLADIIEDQFIDCLNEVGFGGQFRGIPCSEDSECDSLRGICYQNYCVVSPLEEFEDQFLACYIRKMSSSTESFLKANILPPKVADFPKTSPEFYEALKEAATVRDCVNPENPLEIAHRTGYAFTTWNRACLTELLGLSYPEDVDEALTICPPEMCLGSFCQKSMTGCHELCYDRYDYVEATDEPKCVTENSGECTGSYCLYCPPNGDLPCMEVPGIEDQASCDSAIACELPDGSIDFTLTESECRETDVQCTTECAGESCESIGNMKGVCYAFDVDSSVSCELYGSENSVVTEWYQNSLCVLDAVSSQDSCSQYPSSEWGTCQENELEECTGEPFVQRYLGCYISRWHTCSTQEECEESGYCSDREFTVFVRSDQYPVDVQENIALNISLVVLSHMTGLGLVAGQLL